MRILDFMCESFLLCGFYRGFYCVSSYRANSLVQIASCDYAFHCADSIVSILSCSLLCGFHYADSIMRISLCGFHCADSIVRILLCGFYCTDSIMRIPLRGFHCALYCADFIMRIALSTNRHLKCSVALLPVR